LQEKIPGKKEISEWGRVPKFAKGPAVVCGGHGEVHHWKPIMCRGLKKTGTYARQLIIFSFMLFVEKRKYLPLDHALQEGSCMLPNGSKTVGR